ncbi:MAG: 3'-5' exonuclease [Salibacteraceae bacterium]
MGYLDELNEVQRQAVQKTDGPVMVLAGAGSGKTRVLTYRIAYLIENGVDPFNILALTFTNKAAREMKARISRIVGEDLSRNLWMGTFHSIFAKILRIEADRIGYPSNFTIYDSDDSKNLIKTIIKELNLDDKIYKPSLVQRRISAAKNSLMSAAEYEQDTILYSEDLQARRPMLGKIYSAYEARCFKSGAMDFDDLLFKMDLLLRDNPDLLVKYQEKFKYILVDEFQDTNYAQNSILKRLAARHENICVVGDDAQSIYAFRGANIQNILQFKNQYADVAVFKLEQNYRSTKTIVEAANQVIRKNKDQLQKSVWTANDKGDAIKLVKCLSESEEGNHIASEILELKSRWNLNEESFAVLYRTNAQSRAIEEALRKRNIAYRIYGGISFYQRKEIKDLLAYFKMCINPNDEEALKRIINYPTRGIGQTTLDKIILASREEGVSPWQIILDIDAAKLNINSGTLAKIKEFRDLIRGFQAKSLTDSAYEIGQHIAATTGILQEFYRDKTPEGISRYENVQELLSAMREFTELPPVEGENLENNPRSLARFMEDVALMTDVDVKDQKDDNKPKVSTMTIHSAKGLEFPVVFIAGLEEGLFPSQLSINTRADLEEERRLFYVALTRAEKLAILSFAATRFRYGNLHYCEPSRFISEIEPSLMDHSPSRQQKSPSGNGSKNYAVPQHVSQRKLVRPDAAGMAMSESEMKTLRIGSIVKHDRFGEGEIVGLEGEIPNKKAIVDFKNAGRKQLLLKFARLKILNTTK